MPLNPSLLFHGKPLSPLSLFSLFPQTLFFPHRPLSARGCIPVYYHHRHLSTFASSIKRPRASRKVKSNTDLCNDIREFLSTVGLPEGHVPSLKELSQHGRQDLANIVKRRGYKVIREQLAASVRTNIIGSDTEEGLTEKLYASNTTKDESTGQDEKLRAEDSMSNESRIMEHHPSSMDIHWDFKSDEKNCSFVESLASSSLQEKVTKFIQNGVLDTIEDISFDIFNESLSKDGEGFVESPNAIEIESTPVGEEYNQQVLCSTEAVEKFNGNSGLFSQQAAPLVVENGNLRNDDYISTEGQSADQDEDLGVETIEKDNQIEINHLKSMLHQKELELSQLKQWIEKEKHAFSMLQTKAETEISKAQKLISAKDAELHAAEECLSGLEEVEIQFWAEGETVEVAGSFNGWHHRLKMDPQSSSSTMEPTGSRRSRLWRTVLWLYPGTYEIKFVVDGHWMIDPQRESITQGPMLNNILRVNR